ncbi:MAG: flavodoxin family protein [Candidatus Bathyarchaeota archaeon]|nr:flavodoxin family protein [Candidatus Bathyarchaeota archaeon]
MQAVIFDGAAEDDLAVNEIETALCSQLRRSGWAVELIKLREKQIAECLGCFGCWIKTPGECVIDDYGRETTKKVVQSDLLIWVTPITFGGYSSELKKAIDRIIPMLMPYFESYHGEIHHQMRYEKSPKLIVIGTHAANTQTTDTFKALTLRNALNMRPPKYAVGTFQTDQSTKEASAFVGDLLKQVEVVA